MKKGDIVSLKHPGDNLLGLYFSSKSHSDDLQALRLKKEFPRELTVVGMGSISMCCTSIPVVYFEETGRVGFDASGFEVVLLAGEPDVNQIMEESARQAEIQRKWMMLS